MAPVISEAEARVLQALIDMGEATTRDLYETLSEETGWAQPTVITFLRRLETKGLVAHEKVPGQRSFIYSPNKKGHSIGRDQVRTLVERVFGGNPVPLMSMFLEEQPMTSDQLEALRNMLDEHEKKQGEKA